MNGGSILVVHTQLEGRLFGKVGGLEGDLRSMRYQQRKNDKLVSKLQAEVTNGRNASQTLQDQTTALQTRLRAASPRASAISAASGSLAHIQLLIHDSIPVLSILVPNDRPIQLSR